MKSIFTILIATVCGILLGARMFDHSVAAVIVLDVPQTVEEWVDYYATEYKVDKVEMHCTVSHESTYRVAVFGDGGDAFGPSQFHKPTFNEWKEDMGEPTLDYYNFQHQLKVMAWAFSQGDSHKSHWTAWTNYCQ